jgi:hypothetical protein
MGAVVVAIGLCGCVTPEAAKEPATPAAAAAPLAQAPEPPKPDPNAAEQAARALLAQAETDIQRARAKRALWLKAWESLVMARQSAAAKDNVATAQYAKRASELAQLGLEQLAYPAVN